MSRIGKLPIALPQGVKANISKEAVVIEGPKGKLNYKLGRGISVANADGKLVVSVVGNISDKQVKADYGTARATINAMVNGVTKGWKKSLELNGVGFTAKVQGQTLVLSVGYSHDVELHIPTGLKCTVNKNTVEMESHDRQLLGDFAANTRKVCPPEPYLGKGIKYSDERIRRKAGKTGKK